MCLKLVYGMVIATYPFFFTTVLLVGVHVCTVHILCLKRFAKAKCGKWEYVALAWQGRYWMRK